jgi:SAM-dependent methyltransferase
MSMEWEAPAGLFEDRENIGEVFDKIYRLSIWRGGSGLGSHPDVAKPYMLYLQDFLSNNAIRSVVDVGCGDWQFSQFIDWGGASYLGIDVVPSVIEANSQAFGQANREFVCANLASDTHNLPSGDLLLLKDVLQHLSNKNVQQLLKLTSRFKFSLITNAYDPENTDCQNGDTRPLDIRQPPFNLHHAALVWAYHNKAIFLVVSPDRFVS